MITISNLSLSFGDRALFNDITVTFRDDDKVGIIGRNGAGKTTLFKLLTKEQSPDSGEIIIPTNKTLGYLEQELKSNPEYTVIEATKTAFDELLRMIEEIHVLEKKLIEREDYYSDSYLEIAQHLSDLNDIVKNHDIKQLEGNVEKVLKGLGFKTDEFQKKVKELSGGWQIRIEVAKLLLRQPDIILLDEPTNHLDIEAIIWLEDYLRSYPGIVLLISHDQRFLDNVTSRTVEIDNGKVYDYSAPYTKAMLLREERMTNLMSSFKNQQNVIKEKERTIERFMAKATKTKLAQSMQKQLDKMERIELVEFDLKTMTIKFPPVDRSGQIVVKADTISKSYDKNLVLKDIDFQLERSEKVAFVGQNGQGKTTLAKILIHKLDYDAGSVIKGHNVSIGYYAQNQSDLLDKNLTVLETMENNATIETRTNVRNLLGAFMFSGEDADKKVSVLSGGEKARLSIALMLLRPFNFLVLDEPTNHLDILSKEILKKALSEFGGAMLIVSHDREFLSGLTDKIIEFRDRKIKTYLGDINYFLEQRQINDLRNIEISSKITENNINPVDEISPEQKKQSKISFEERKNNQRNLKKIENQISKLEENINNIENQMQDPDFHKDDKAIEKLKYHSEWKIQLNDLMDQWAELQEQFEEFQ